MVEHVLRYGYATLFLYVLVSQLGVPAPSAPLLIAAGALVANGRIALVPAIASVVIACLCADSTWFSMGRARGRQVIGLLCRLSLEPASCIQTTEGAMHGYGMRFLLVGKFLPGLGLMAAPVAGESRTPFWKFLAFDAAGALLWSSTYLLVGRFFGALIERNAHLLQLSAPIAAAGVVAMLVGAVVRRLLRRRRFRQKLTSAGISPAELKARMDRGESFFVVDLRHFPPARGKPQSLSGAVNLPPDRILADGVVPRDRDVVVICDCPGDAGSAQIATTLKTRGIERVHHLLGGIEGWKRAGYPVVEIEPLEPRPAPLNWVAVAGAEPQPWSRRQPPSGR
jgi:membrane protein DedA with SNARE-associated domain/rhodanese-related sulfurtransferase